METGIEGGRKRECVRGKRESREGASERAKMQRETAWKKTKKSCSFD